MTKSYYIETLGCSKNQDDSAIMCGILDSCHYQFVEDAQLADVIIVNTCGFIESAKEESIDTILGLSQYKQNGSCQYLIATGCLAQRYADDLKLEMPEVDAFIGTTAFSEIVKVIQLLEDNRQVISRIDDIDLIIDDTLPKRKHSDKVTAHLKIAEGCDNTCTYCIIPKLRGKYRSRKIESVIAEAVELVSQGVKELIIIAQDTTRYGYDLYGRYRLLDLLTELDKLDHLEWIRIQYMYPDILDEHFIKGVASLNKVVNYFDIPIQHASNLILKRMARHTTNEQINNVIDSIRKHCQDATIRTTLIVGFPGESDADFEVLTDFISRVKFDKLGAFTYSLEEGTAAYLLDNRVESEIALKRFDELMQIQKDISEEIQLQKIGKTYTVLIEEIIEHEQIYLGRTKYDAPEIDGVCYVHTNGRKLSIGDFVEVGINDALEYDIIGDLL